MQLSRAIEVDDGSKGGRMSIEVELYRFGVQVVAVAEGQQLLPCPAAAQPTETRPRQTGERRPEDLVTDSAND